MAAPLLSRKSPLLRACFHNYKRFTVGAVTAHHRLWCSAAITPPSDKPNDNINSGNNTLNLRKDVYPSLSSNLRLEDDEPKSRIWKDIENEILVDIQTILLFTKAILHSPNRYLDGERLTLEDEKFVVEKLLAYHPHYEDKIGCGIESIMVDRPPEFRYTRCFFVVRTDGSWIDFSYRMCLWEYIREKYPAHAERLIREHRKLSRK